MKAHLRIAGLIGLCLAVVAAGPPRAAADARAVASLTRTLAAQETQHGRASSFLLPVIDKLAQAQFRNGALAEAAALRQRALSIAIAAFGCASPQAAEAMAALARLDLDRRRYLDTEPLLLIAERVLAGRPDSPATAATMVAILAGRARIALARGKTQQAESWARRAVALARRRPQGRSAEPLRALGAVLIAEERYREADAVIGEALAQDRRQHDADSVDMAQSLSLLAHLRLRQGKPREALPSIERATAIDQSRLAATHPFIADDFFDLGLVYRALQRDGAALRAFLAARDVLERGSGRETPRVAYVELELARLYRGRGDDAAADAAFHDARRILNKAEAEEHRRERKI